MSFHVSILAIANKETDSETAIRSERFGGYINNRVSGSFFNALMSGNNRTEWFWVEGLLVKTIPMKKVFKNHRLGVTRYM